MLLIVEIRDGEVWRRLEGGAATRLSPPVGPQADGATLPADCCGQLEDWGQRYGRAAAAEAEEALRRLGGEIYAWLDQGGALADWVASGAPTLEVWAGLTAGDTLTKALLAAPWEVLAREGVFLAEDRMRLFAVARRCGGTAAPKAPEHGDLSLLLMAAAVEGQSELNYELEEAAILEATQPTTSAAPLAHVTVEESGALEVLADRNRLDGPFEALHLSCHGEILQVDGRATPELMLETAEGGADPVAPERLVSALEGRLPPLVFLSACRTAERGAGRAQLVRAAEGRREGLAKPGLGGVLQSAAGEPTAAPELAEPYARRLAGRVANVLSWDGSVYDSAATRFAEALYGALARGETVARAAALARRALFDARQQDPKQGRHWHLARVYLGPGGGGALCDPARETRPPPPPTAEAFLDPQHQRVPVATRAQFVGRRRQIQWVLAAYRAGRKGVLVHGMGHLGKSSLAARVADRMAKSHRTAVVHGSYHALAVFEQIAAVATSIADQLELTEGQKLTNEIDALRAMVTVDEAALENALRRLLRGVYTRHPTLLVIDDLEQALETPTQTKTVVEPRPELRQALAAVLAAFEQAPQTPSRLLLTSRYDFALKDAGGRDRAAALVRVPLVPMRPVERRKQWRARAHAEKREAEAAKAEPTLLARASRGGGQSGAAGDPNPAVVARRGGGGRGRHRRDRALPCHRRLSRGGQRCVGVLHAGVVRDLRRGADRCPEDGPVGGDAVQRRGGNPTHRAHRCGGGAGRCRRGGRARSVAGPRPARRLGADASVGGRLQRATRRGEPAGTAAD